MGGGKSGGSDTSALMPFAKQFNAETQPLVKEQLGQALSALQTGGNAARIPLIESATTTSQNALSATLRSLRDTAAGSGAANSPFTLANIGSAAVTGRQGIANIGPQMADQSVSGGQGIFGAIMSALGGSRSGSTHGKNTQIL